MVVNEKMMRKLCVFAAPSHPSALGGRSGSLVQAQMTAEINFTRYREWELFSRHRRQREPSAKPGRKPNPKVPKYENLTHAG